MRTKAHTLVLSALLLGLCLVFLPACDNPFDPLEETDEIKGLTYFDWAATWERWDPDPEYDGMAFTMEYFNEYGDNLEFKDKPHQIKIEFYTQKTVGEEYDQQGNPVQGSGILTFDRLIFQHSVTFKNTDDDIRIAKELYEDVVRTGARDPEQDNQTEYKVYIVVRVYPPKGKPRVELVVGYPDQVVLKEEPDEFQPNP